MYQLGEYLKRLRGDLSLREAAKRSGISYTYIGALEKGKHPKTGEEIKPSSDTLKSLAKAYNSDYEELLKVAGILDEDKSDEDIVDLEVLLMDPNLTVNGKPASKQLREDILAYVRIQKAKDM